MSAVLYINEITKDIFPIDFNMIEQSELNDPDQTAKLICQKNKQGQSHEERNKIFDIIMCEDIIVSLSKLQR